MRTAFAALHGQRLHGFTLLLLLGEEGRAREIASSALVGGMANVLALRHPERAAAWLRADVLRLARRGTTHRRVAPEGLSRLGVTSPVGEALAALDMEPRAALIAADVEQLDLRDVDTVVGRSPASGARLLADTRRRYVAAFQGPAEVSGPLAQRIAAIAAAVGRFGPAPR